jgi:transposase
VKHSSDSRRAVFGLDLGDRSSDLSFFKGDKIVHETLPTSIEEIRRRFKEEPTSRVILEAGSQSHWIVWELESLGHETVVAHPRRLRALFQAGQKTDRSDSEWLLRLGASDLGLITPIRVRSRGRQGDLAVLRSRNALCRMRVHAIQAVRGMCKTFGMQLPRCSTDCFARKAAPSIPCELHTACQPLLVQIQSLTESLRRIDRTLERIRKTRYPETETLMQIQTVGSLTSLTFVLTLQDSARFVSSRDVGPFLGLVPRKRASGARDPELGITKTGDVEMRRLLVLRSHYIISSRGEDCDLKRWGLMLAARGGKNAKKRAIIAVARRLAVLMHRLWVTGEVYEPLRQAERQAAA